MKFSFLILGLRSQRYLTNTKRHPPKKFLETLNLFFQLELPGKKTDAIMFTFPVTSQDQSNFSKPHPFLEIQAGRKNPGYFKTFLGDISLYMLNVFATATPKKKQKISKNYLSILAIVNYRNWLNTSPIFIVKIRS